MVRPIAPLIIGSLLLTATPAAARTVAVATSAELEQAINNAQAGDLIELAKGTYALSKNLSCAAVGTEQAPIIVRGAPELASQIEFDAVEGFKVSGAHWRFEGLDIRGVCGDHSKCEHAFHIFGAAHASVVRGCKLHGYNAQIKGNGTPIGTGGAYVYPNDVLIEGNEFFNETQRNTSNPVTPIDVVGGRRWILRANFIHDHAKAEGNGISYAAFLKGNSKDGAIERNLVVCELLHTGKLRLGLSFGGGGTGPDSICEEGSCTPEHEGGVMRNNIIINCPQDVGIYLNEAKDVLIHNNTLFNNAGIDVRFAASVATLKNNLLSGVIRERDGGTANKAGGGNLESVSAASFTAWFKDPARGDFALLNGASVVDRGVAAEVLDDYCGSLRSDGKHDVGALEYLKGQACDSTRTWVDPATGPTDGGMAAADRGVASDGGVDSADTSVTGADGSPAGEGPAAPGPDRGPSGRDSGAAAGAVSGGCTLGPSRPGVHLAPLLALLAIAPLLSLLALARRRRR